MSLFEPSLLTTFLALFMRCLGFCCLLPLGAGAGANARKVAIALAISACAFEPKGAIDIGSLAFLAEFIFGLVSALPLLLALELARMAGELFDSSRGQSMASVFDPFSNQNASLMGKLFFYGLLATLFYKGILCLLLQGLLAKNSILTINSAELSQGAELLIINIAAALSSLFAFFLPFGLLFLLCDLLLAQVAKLFPGIPIFAESFVLKSMTGFLLLLLMLQVELPFWDHFETNPLLNFQTSIPLFDSGSTP